MNELALLQSQVKDFRFQDKLGNQNINEVMKKVFEPVAFTNKESANEISEAVKDTTKAIQLKGKEARKSNEMEDILEYVITSELRLLEPYAELTISKVTCRFQMRAIFILKVFYKDEDLPVATHGHNLIFTDGN